MGGAYHQGGDAGGNYAGGGGGGYYGGGGGSYDGIYGGAGGGGGSSYITDPLFTFIFGGSSPNGRDAPFTNDTVYQNGVANGGNSKGNGGNGLIVIQPVQNITERFSTGKVGPYINVASHFTSSITTQNINDSTYMTNTNIYASSVTAVNFYGDGISLSNVSKTYPYATFTNLNIAGSLPSGYNANFVTGSIVASNVLISTFGTADGGPRLQADKGITISTIKFISSSEVFVAVGADVLQKTVLYNTENSTWSNASQPLFDGAGMAVKSNSNADNPLYIAVGQSQNPLRTILWSKNGSNWNSINTGGFLGGSGNDVTYSPELSRWVAVGNDPTAGIQYSSDGSNWFAATNPFDMGAVPNYHNFVGWSANTNSFAAFSVTSDGTAEGNTVMKASDNGMRWFDIPIFIVQPYFYAADFTKIGGKALGYGYVSSIGNAWVFIGYTPPVASNNPIGTGPTFIYSTDGFNWVGKADYSTLPIALDDVQSLSYFPDTSRWYIGGNARTPGGPTAYFSPDMYSWTSTSLTSVAYSFSYDSAISTIFAGTSNTSTTQTLWRSVNQSTFTNINYIGFSSGLIQVGVPYGIFTAPNTLQTDGLSNTSLFVFGTQSSNTTGSMIPVVQALKGDYSTAVPRYSLSPYQLLNTFSTTIRNMVYGLTNSNYTVVAVGDSIASQATIMRASSINVSVNTPGGYYLSSFVPALIGGFTTSGYDVTYYTPSNIWLAVGDSYASEKTIQASVDTTNWYGINTNQGVRTAATSINWAPFQGSNRIIVTGADPLSNHCILISDGDYTRWRSTIGTIGFSGNQANAVAIGQDSIIVTGNRDPNSINPVFETIKYTQDTLIWKNVQKGGFSNGGYGLATKSPIYAFVAGGPTPLGDQGTDTLKYSLDGISWYPAVNGIKNTAYVVYWFDFLQKYIAGAISSDGIKYSTDGKYWFNTSTIFTELVGGINQVVTAEGSNALYALGYAAGRYAVASTNMISYDGINWSTMQSPYAVAFGSTVEPVGNVVRFNNNYYVGAGDTGSDGNFGGLWQGAAVRYSRDFIYWNDTSLVHAPYARLRCAWLESGYSGTTPVIVASFGVSYYDQNYGVMYSTDGVNFSPISYPDTTWYYNFTFYRMKYVAGGAGHPWVATTGNGQMWYSDTGSNWSQGTTAFSGGTGRQITYNTATSTWYCAGNIGLNPLIVYSGDAVNWSNYSAIQCGNLSSLQYAMCIATNSVLMPQYSSITVAVGDNNEINSRYAIQYSYDGGIRFNSTNTQTFSKKGTNVFYDAPRSTFFATGEEILGVQGGQILQSADGANWSSITYFPSTANFFPTQQVVGIGRGILTQSINATEEKELINVESFRFYNRPTPYLGIASTNTLRLTSTSMVFNETLFMNLSTQVMIGTSNQQAGASLTVAGTTYASSVILTGSTFNIVNNFTVSSLLVSSLVLNSSILHFGSLQTPGLTIAQTSITNPSGVSTPNFIQSFSNSGIRANNLFITPSSVGINSFASSFFFYVSSTVGTVSTSVDSIFAVQSSITISPQLYKSTLLNMNGVLSISETEFAPTNTANTIYSLSNTLSFNKLFFLTLSTQRIGIGTSTPQYNLDVQYPMIMNAGIISSPSVTIGALRPSIIYF